MKEIYERELLQKYSRRQVLQRWGCGFGSVALASMLQADSWASSGTAAKTHHEARAKRIIFLYMDGGPSQMDTFDPKPELEKFHGKPFPMATAPTQFDNNGTTLASPWQFNRYGESGLWVSSLFPYVAEHVDKLCVIRSMTSQFSEHTSANYFLHTGLGIAGRPSMGAWSVYGLGRDSEDLPGYVVIDGGLTPPGGLDNFSNGFLPATYQGSIFSPTGSALANLSPPQQIDLSRMQRRRSALQALDQLYDTAGQLPDAIDSAIENYQLAYRMQTTVPEASNLVDESAETLAMYGIDSPNAATAVFGRECLLARRLAERGVRFIELTCPSISGIDRWDQHGNLMGGHTENAKAVDQPIAGLLQDLEQRGMLHETLVVWAGEFGRTPFAQGADGRDHNPFAFTLWMAGGGCRGGMTYGESDEFGYKVIDKPLEIHDLHATMLHLLGFDHERLTFRFGGRDHRLTDVHGKVIRDIVA